MTEKEEITSTEFPESGNTTSTKGPRAFKCGRTQRQGYIETGTHETRLIKHCTFMISLNLAPGKDIRGHIETGAHQDEGTYKWEHIEMGNKRILYL